MLQVRLPHKSLADNTELRLRAGTLSTELSCPICLDLLTQTMTTKECLHRFCADCITTALFRGNKECPTCRKKLVSKRSLRPDPNFDSLIAKIWAFRNSYVHGKPLFLEHVFLSMANPYSSHSLMSTITEFQCDL
ncbi:unnamed protein product [Angiostrongylus costaricensis]|uniref:RING-type E3 ubiquitin transferase n=1 Tax=Angiostrongylus costaricensis TaxID=334426 RepID=A0A0R3PHH8_ANGCS|nr:unnamed protein product [Angiostrongylus costaricensis]